MRISEAREEVLKALASFSLDELRLPQSSRMYPAEQILMSPGFVLGKVSPDVERYLRNANPLVRASLEASIDTSIRERESRNRMPLRRRRRR